MTTAEHFSSTLNPPTRWTKPMLAGYLNEQLLSQEFYFSDLLIVRIARSGHTSPKAADWYQKWASRLDRITTLRTAVVTIALVWTEIPTIVPTAIAILIGVASGYKTAAKPQQKSESHYRAEEAYYKLFDQFRDFILLELSDGEDYLLLKDQYLELNNKRRELNEDMPQIRSKWYNILDESILLRIGSQAKLVKGVQIECE